MATGTYNLLLGSERNKPALFAVNLLVDLFVGFNVVPFAAQQISYFPSIANCYLPNQPTSPQCAGYLNQFLIVAGIYLAISLALGFVIPHPFSSWPLPSVRTWRSMLKHIVASHICLSFCSDWCSSFSQADRGRSGAT